MDETSKNNSYYRDKHILFEGDEVVFRRLKSTPDEERERTTQGHWTMPLKVSSQ